MEEEESSSMTRISGAGEEEGGGRFVVGKGWSIIELRKGGVKGVEDVSRKEICEVQKAFDCEKEDSDNGRKQCCEKISLNSEENGRKNDEGSGKGSKRG